MATTVGGTSVEQLLGDEAESLLAHRCHTIPAERLTLPGPGWVDEVMAFSDRPNPVLRSLASMFGHGRLAGTGYLSILPVDQGIEHSAGASFAPNPDYFDPLKIVELAVEGGCNAVATTLGALGLASRRWAHHIPFMLKINHNEFLSLSQRLRPDHVRVGEAGAGDGLRRGGRHDLLRLARVEAADHGGVDRLRGRARAGDGDRALVLHAQLGLQPQERRSGLPPGGRPHGPGQPPGRDDRGRHHQAEAPRDGGPGLHRPRLRKDRSEGLLGAHDRPPHRHDPVPARQLLHGPHPAHQLGRRVVGRQRPGRGRPHGGHQQARRRRGPHLRPQGVPAPDGGRCGAA